MEEQARGMLGEQIPGQDPFPELTGLVKQYFSTPEQRAAYSDQEDQFAADLTVAFGITGGFDAVKTNAHLKRLLMLVVEDGAIVLQSNEVKDGKMREKLIKSHEFHQRDMNALIEDLKNVRGFDREKAGHVLGKLTELFVPQIAGIDAQELATQ